jgi:uncharacterized membrane protein YjjP (DUF1212 family)/uncharacterized membrane protein YjjB (DUF3815 family)
MTYPTEDSARIGSPAEFRRLIVQLGTAMVAAGDAVDIIEESLRRIVGAYGVAGLQVALLPTSLFVQTGTGDSAHVQFSSQVAPPLRLDQIDGLYRLVKQLERAELTVPEASKELNAVYRQRPTFRWPLRTVGHAVLTAGLALLLQPTPGGIAAASALGLLIGVLKLARLPTVTLVFPILTSFLTAAAVFWSAGYLHVDNPIRLLVAPLVTFLPGGMLAIATMEIAAGQMVSGASRLVNGFVQLALLAFGIVAAGALLRASPADFADHRVAGLGTWAGWAGVTVFAVGIYLHFSAPLRSLPWLLLVLYVAFAGQTIGDALFGGQISGFFGAVVMTPVVLWAERLPSGPPKLVTFLPAFWLLVPGAAGLIGVTQIVGAGLDVTARGLSDLLITIISISLGVLIGTAAHRAANAGLRRLPIDRSARMRQEAASGRNGVLSGWRLPSRRQTTKEV